LNYTLIPKEVFFDRFPPKVFRFYF